MGDRYRVGNHQSRNIYRVNQRSDDRQHDEPVAVAFDPEFGPVIVDALNARAAEVDG